MCPEKYFVSVVRFDISTNLPVFIPKLVLNQSNPNLLAYQMWIYSATSAVSVPIQFTWTTQGVSPTPAPDQSPNYTYQQMQTDYYYCYSYQYFLDLMNKQISAAISSLIPTLKVWFTMDAATLNLHLNFTSTNLSDAPRFFVNAPLKNLMQALAYKVGAIPLTLSPPSAYEITWYNADATPLTTPFVISTETSPFPNWNPVSSVVFTTVTLPVIPTNESLPVIYGANTSIGSAGNTSSNNNSATVLTDFVVNVGPGSLYNPIIQYLPTAEYRLNDMYGNSPLSNIDLQVFWKDKYSNYYPLLIPAGGSASIKLMFRKKNYNTSSKNVIV